MSANGRPATTRIRHYVEFLVALALGWGMRPIPRRTRLGLGRWAGSIVFALDAKHRRVTIDNLTTAFGSTKTGEEKYAIARATFRHFGAMLFELLTLGRPLWRRVERIVEFEGIENYERAREAGRGVLLVAAHFGNWEIHGLAHGYRFGPMAVVARPQDNPHYNRLLEQIRTTSGNTVLYKQRALARMMRLLKDGETVGVVIDQNVTREDGVFVEYFGHVAATTPVASWLAVKTGAALVPLFALPLADGRYRLIYEKPIDRRLYSAADQQAAVQDLTQECARILEGYVRRNPEFWLWMHRRWKTRPTDEDVVPAALRAGEAGRRA